MFKAAKRGLLGSTLKLLREPIYVSLLTGDVTNYDSSLDELRVYSIGIPSELTSKAVVDDTFGADNVSIEGIPAGLTIKALLIHSSILPIVYIDEANYGLPLVTTGGPIQILWNTGSNKIFRL